MVEILFLFVFFTLITLALRGFYKSLRTKSSNGLAQVFTILFNFSFLSYVFVEIVQFYNWFFIHRAISASLVGVICGCSISFIFTNLINEISKKKLKTLLRLPLIGGLAFYYFHADIDVKILWCLVEILGFSILINKRQSYPYIYRQQFKVTLALVVGFLSFSLFAAPFFYIGVIFYLIFKWQIHNALYVKIIVSMKKQEEQSE